MSLSVGIVVPNYNGARFLADAIESMLQPSTARVRCLVMDGGSTDESLAVLRKYKDRIEIVSERDEGQADAIARGFERLDTDLVGWLNSDDRLLPGAIDRIVAAAEQRRDAVLFFGDAELIDHRGRLFGVIDAVDLDAKRLRSSRGKIVQPGSFYRREAVRACGGIRKEFYLLMDVDLWIRLAQTGPCVRLPARLAQFRVHEGAKSSKAPLRYYKESLRIAWRHDRTARGLGRRAVNVARHYVGWRLGLSVQSTSIAPDPRSPVRVACGVAVPDGLQRLAEGGGVALVAKSEADVTIESATTLRSPRGGRWRRSAGAIAPIVALVDRSDKGELEAKAPAAVAYYVCDGGTHAADMLRGRGVPDFRIGPATSEADWQALLDVALGALPRGGLASC